MSLSVTLLSIRIAPRYANVNTDRVASISKYPTYQSVYVISQNMHIFLKIFIQARVRVDLF